MAAIWDQDFRMALGWGLACGEMTSILIHRFLFLLYVVAIQEYRDCSRWCFQQGEDGVGGKFLGMAGGMSL